MSEEAKKCRYCGATLVGKGKFCVECGKSTEPEKTKCPKCGFEIEGKIKFCPDCGHAFASVSSADYVRIPGTDYCMGKYAVTQELYKRVTGENPSEFRGAKRPVETVSWYDAIVFCNKMSKAEGKEPVYSVDGETDTEEWNYTPHDVNSIEGNITQNLNANGYRLPTKEEWHYAAKGGQDYTYAGSDDIDEVAWYRQNSGKRNLSGDWNRDKLKENECQTHEVGQLKPNGYGLYDMSGNVLEWCWDSDVYGRRYFCGGSWGNEAERCRVDYEYWDCANYGYYNIGFRLVCLA